ncbi:hypothetical protein J4734_20065 [Klebsiella pneumoniae]|uniref:LysR family transcriptional regulator n=1 Tax=Klebsiella pneumoniae TaxID=573 RepID=A0A939NUM5_KLEPN|nr:hypothetical protein [Klebsiella pneumoniae]
MEAKAARLGLGLAYVPEELITDDQPVAHLSGCSSVIASVWKVHLLHPHRNVARAESGH